MSKKTLKKIWIVLAVIIVVVVALLIWLFADTAIGRRGEFTAEISRSDSWKIRLALIMVDFDGFNYEYACGFSESFSVEIGGLTYCLAQDDCDTVYIKELDLYYGISSGNNQMLRTILAQYGISP